MLQHRLCPYCPPADSDSAYKDNIATIDASQRRREGEEENRGEMKAAQKVSIILALVGMTLIGDSKGTSCKFIIQARASISLCSLLQVVSVSMDQEPITSLRVMRLEHI